MTRFIRVGPTRFALPALFALVALTACGDATPTRTFRVRDSAGVAIAENTGPVPAPGAFALSPEPVLQIGALEGDDAYLFGRIRDMVRLSDGRIAVADDRASQVRVFGADGRHLRTLGGRGEGPGEFDGPDFLGVLPGDTLVVVDTRQRRINLFHPDDGFLGSATASDDVPGYLMVAGMFGDGTLVDVRTVFDTEHPEGYARRPVECRAVDLNGELTAELGTFPGYEAVLAMVSEGDQTFAMTGEAPFGKEGVVAVAGDRAFYGSQDAWEIRVLGPDGSLQRLIRWYREPRPVTEAEAAAFIEDLVSGMDDNNLARRYRRFYNDAPVPEMHPAHGDLFVDRLGWLWVQEYRIDADEAPDRWVALDPEGRVAGSIDLPPRFRIEDIGDDYVLGRWVDELDVSYVRMYGLTRPE